MKGAIVKRKFPVLLSLLLPLTVLGPLPVQAATYQFRVPIIGVPVPPALTHAPVTQTFAFDQNNFITETNLIEHTDYVLSIPAWARKAEVRVSAAGGSANYCGNGGSGAYIDVVVYAPFGGTSVAITVGKGGRAAYSQGGGYTSVLIGNQRVVAGSGGAGAVSSGGGCLVPLNGGNGGLPSGHPGSASANTGIGAPGFGGTQSGPGAGGSAAVCTTAVAPSGFGHYGGGVAYGGGGGDGWYGGGGGVPGNSGCTEGGSGGGGSSYVPNGSTVISVGIAHNGSTPAGPGGNGSITITWKP